MGRLWCYAAVCISLTYTTRKISSVIILSRNSQGPLTYSCFRPTRFQQVSALPPPLHASHSAWQSLIWSHVIPPSLISIMSCFVWGPQSCSIFLRSLHSVWRSSLLAILFRPLPHHIADWLLSTHTHTCTYTQRNRGLFNTHTHTQVCTHTYTHKNKKTHTVRAAVPPLFFCACHPESASDCCCRCCFLHPERRCCWPAYPLAHCCCYCCWHREFRCCYPPARDCVHVCECGCMRE